MFAAEKDMVHAEDFPDSVVGHGGCVYALRRRACDDGAAEFVYLPAAEVAQLDARGSSEGGTATLLQSLGWKARMDSSKRKLYFTKLSDTSVKVWTLPAYGDDTAQSKAAIAAKATTKAKKRNSSSKASGSKKKKSSKIPMSGDGIIDPFHVGRLPRTDDPDDSESSASDNENAAGYGDDWKRSTIADYDALRVPALPAYGDDYLPLDNIISSATQFVAGCASSAPVDAAYLVDEESYPPVSMSRGHERKLESYEDDDVLLYASHPPVSSPTPINTQARLSYPQNVHSNSTSVIEKGHDEALAPVVSSCDDQQMRDLVTDEEYLRCDMEMEEGSDRDVIAYEAAAEYEDLVFRLGSAAALHHSSPPATHVVEPPTSVGAPVDAEAVVVSELAGLLQEEAASQQEYAVLEVERELVAELLANRGGNDAETSPPSEGSAAERIEASAPTPLEALLERIEASSPSSNAFVRPHLLPVQTNSQVDEPYLQATEHASPTMSDTTSSYSGVAIHLRNDSLQIAHQPEVHREYVHDATLHPEAHVHVDSADYHSFAMQHAVECSGGGRRRSKNSGEDSVHPTIMSPTSTVASGAQLFASATNEDSATNRSRSEALPQSPESTPPSSPPQPRRRTVALLAAGEAEAGRHQTARRRVAQTGPSSLALDATLADDDGELEKKLLAIMQRSANPDHASKAAMQWLRQQNTADHATTDYQVDAHLPSRDARGAACFPEGDAPASPELSRLLATNDSIYIAKHPATHAQYVSTHHDEEFPGLVSTGRDDVDGAIHHGRTANVARHSAVVVTSPHLLSASDGDMSASLSGDMFPRLKNLKDSIYIARNPQEHQVHIRDQQQQAREDPRLEEDELLEPTDENRHRSDPDRGMQHFVLQVNEEERFYEGISRRESLYTARGESAGSDDGSVGSGGGKDASLDLTSNARGGVSSAAQGALPPSRNVKDSIYIARNPQQHREYVKEHAATAAELNRREWLDIERERQRVVLREQRMADASNSHQLNVLTADDALHRLRQLTAQLVVDEEKQHAQLSGGSTKILPRIDPSQEMLRLRTEATLAAAHIHTDNRAAPSTASRNEAVASFVQAADRMVRGINNSTTAPPMPESPSFVPQMQQHSDDNTRTTANVLSVDSIAEQRLEQVLQRLLLQDSIYLYQQALDAKLLESANWTLEAVNIFQRFMETMPPKVREASVQAPEQKLVLVDAATQPRLPPGFTPSSVQQQHEVETSTTTIYGEGGAAAQPVDVFAFAKHVAETEDAEYRRRMEAIRQLQTDTDSRTRFTDSTVSQAYVYVPYTSHVGLPTTAAEDLSPLPSAIGGSVARHHRLLVEHAPSRSILTPPVPQDLARTERAHFNSGGDLRGSLAVTPAHDGETALVAQPFLRPFPASPSAAHMAFLRWDTKRSGNVLVSQSGTLVMADASRALKVIQDTEAAEQHQQRVGAASPLPSASAPLRHRPANVIIPMYALGTVGISQGDFVFEVRLELKPSKEALPPPSPGLPSHSASLHGPLRHGQRAPASLCYVGVASKYYRGAQRNTPAYLYCTDGTITATSTEVNGVPYGRRMHAQAVVTVHLSFSKRELTFAVDGVSQGVAFKFQRQDDPEPLFPLVVFQGDGDSCALQPPSVSEIGAVSSSRHRRSPQHLEGSSNRRQTSPRLPPSSASRPAGQQATPQPPRQDTIRPLGTPHHHDSWRGEVHHDRSSARRDVARPLY